MATLRPSVLSSLSLETEAQICGVCGGKGGIAPGPSTKMLSLHVSGPLQRLWTHLPNVLLHGFSQVC